MSAAAAPEWPPAQPVTGPLAERLLGPDDLDRVLALHAALHRAATVPGLFVRETPEFFAWHLDAGGRVPGLEAPDGTLVAYAVLGLPDADAPENFGRMLDLPAAERARVCHLDGAGVLPCRRGQGLQRRLTRARLGLAAAAGRPLALSTAALHNAWSVANLTAEGLRVVALVGKYDALRLVLRRDPGPARPVPADVVGVPLDGSEAGHRAQLAAGREGVAVCRAAGAPMLLYAPAGAAP